VELLPERVGSPLSVNALREDLGVAYDTTKAWLATLARLYYAFELRPFAGKLARTLRREAKVYLFDFTEIDDPGARFENLVARHLTKLVDAWNTSARTGSAVGSRLRWRTRSGWRVGRHRSTPCAASCAASAEPTKPVPPINSTLRASMLSPFPASRDNADGTGWRGPSFTHAW
jgi:hypothetical protein